jgi:nucleoside-diphosphate-sugar epimerase
MPIITPGSKVLVSGANGYLACWVIRTLLEKGYAVRGAVRSPEKGAHLLELFKSFGKKFELVIVRDITKASTITSIIMSLPSLCSSAHYTPYGN